MMEISKLIEELKKVLYKDKIYEFTMPIKQLKERIQDRTPIIFEHMYKIIGFGEEYKSTVHHWCAELGGFLKICNIKVKNTNKVLSPYIITDMMIEVYDDVKEFSSIGGELYSEYGYSKYKDSEIYGRVKRRLPKVIEYIQGLKEDERCNPNTILELIEE